MNQWITVITVSFNSSETISAAINSVIQQDWPNIEHILIDGGSTDGTIEIIENNRSHFSHIICEPDNGIYDAMNKGLALATGDIICFLNADDQYASSDVLSKVVERMSKDQLDAFMGDVGFFHKENPKKMIRRYRSDFFSPKKLIWGWMPAHPGLFMHKDTIKRVGQFKTDYQIAGDYEYIVRVFHGQTLKYDHTPEVLVHMQTGGASNNGWRARVQLNLEVLRACKENGMRTNLFMILSKYPWKILEMFRK